jgi:hypothetical protein
MGGALTMSIGRGAVSLAIGFLTGIFLSAFALMIAESAGTPMRSEWLGLIVLVVMVGGFFPIHHLVWGKTSGLQAAPSHEDVVTATHPGTENER